MIKFFRNIRQKLLSENPTDGRTGKINRYIIYASGEIILVVIGILIALQINNWNENRKKDDLKQNYSINLINDLQKDTLQLKQRVLANQNHLRIINSVNKFISESQLTHKDLADSLIQNYNNIGLRITNTYNNNTFNIIESSGNIDIFENDIIKELMELNRLQLEEIKVSSGNRENYFDGFGNYRDLYLYSNYIGNPEFSASLASSYDTDAFLKFYINSNTIQIMAINRYIDQTNLVISQTEKVLHLLSDELE